MYTCCAPTAAYSALSVFWQPSPGVKVLLLASNPASHSACWPELLNTKSMNSLAESGLAAPAVIPMPRGISGVKSLVYSQPTSLRSAALDSMGPRTSPDSKTATPYPPWATSVPSTSPSPGVCAVWPSLSSAAQPCVCTYPQKAL